MKNKEIIHYAIGQCYTGVREDGKRVAMVPIACTMTRVFLPRGHKAVHSDKVTCKVCIEKLIEHYAESIEEMNVRLDTSVKDETKFLVSKREKQRQLYSGWLRNTPKPDAETLERLRQ